MQKYKLGSSLALVATGLEEEKNNLDSASVGKYNGAVCITLTLCGIIAKKKKKVDALLYSALSTFSELSILLAEFFFKHV